MRTFAAITIVAGLTLSFTTAIRADNEIGYIGVQIKKVAEGFEVTQFFPGGPADKGGFKQGDVIKKWDGSEIQLLPIEVFVGKIRGAKPGDEIKFTVIRDGKEKELKVKVGKVGG